MALFALMVAFFILFSDGVHPLPSVSLAIQLARTL